MGWIKLYKYILFWILINKFDYELYLDFKTCIRTLKQDLGRLNKVKSIMEFKDELWKYIKTD